MGQKVMFDGLTKIITITQAPDANDTVTINVKQDLYSDGKEDWVANESLRKFSFPITSIGGNPLPGNKYVGATFFLDSEWKIQPYLADHRMVVEGNLYAEDGSNPFLPVINYTVSVLQEVSTLVIKVPGVLTTEQNNKLMNLPSEEDISTTVWTDNNAEDLLSSTEFLLRIIKNKREVKKDSQGWKLVVYDEYGINTILEKYLKDKNGNDISDLKVGVLTQELASSV